MNATSTPRQGYRQAYCETEIEDSGSGSGSESENENENENETAETTRPPPNVGTKRSSDPSLAKKPNKYANSDSGYSSLTSATASSSHAKSAVPGQSAIKRVVNAIKKPKESAAPPTERRRSARRRDTADLRLRHVESREEAAKMRPSGQPTHISSERSPSYTSGMPGAFPTSPAGITYGSSTPSVPIPPPPSGQRTRAASTTYQQYGGRPLSFTTPGSLPSVMYALQQPEFQQHVQQQIQQHMQQRRQQQTPQPQLVQIEQYPPPHMMHQQQQHYSGTPGTYQISMDPYGGHMGYMPNPASSTPTNHAGYAYTSTSQQTYYPTHIQTPSWPLESNPYAPPPPPPPPLALAPPPSRRMSMGGESDYGHGGPQYNQVHYPPPPQYPVASAAWQRRLSQTVSHIDSPYRPPPPPPPPQTPTDEGVFFEDEDYYRMPPPPPPPPRPSSSHPQRPMIHSRTTSSVPQHRLSRGSIEYYDVSPRKASFDGGRERPPSRPGLSQRYSTSSTRMYLPEPPPSPAKRRHAPSFPGDLEAAQMQMQKQRDAEAYQNMTGPHNGQVTASDIPLTRRTTKNSDTGSRGSGSRDGSDQKQSRRISRQSLDKQRTRELYERERDRDSRDGYGKENYGSGGIDVSFNGGTSLTIKQSRDGDGMSLSFANPNGAAASNSRPPSRSTKPAREPSRVRSGGSKKCIEGSSTSSKSQEKAEYEVPRPQRSSSVKPNIGIDDISKSMRKLKMEDVRLRESRSSSRSGHVRK